MSGYLGKGLAKLMVILKGSAVPERLKNAILQNTTEFTCYFVFLLIDSTCFGY